MRRSLTPLHTDLWIWSEAAMEFLPERWMGLKQSWNNLPFMGAIVFALRNRTHRQMWPLF